MVTRKYKRKLEELTIDEINQIHQLIRQGIRIKTIIQMMNINQKAINRLYERDEKGQPIYNLNNNNNDTN
tara:strand:+ start:1788 stop:1997 length:210 start_codon:yes stop_codon:yes gene_type:complete